MNSAESKELHPVLDKEGKLENFILKVAGERFRCSCGCNVFHKPDSTRQELYECNACGVWMEST